MFASSLPPVTTLESHDGRPPADERLARVRAEVAIVRTLVDHIERLTDPGQADALSQQLIEEMGRLGGLWFETAGELTKTPPAEGAIGSVARATV
jgi:hypothetical protein